ncbi:HPr family phosphocarrier protein [Proteocatella sphenisci]|uniref:HPr family phosphocarrier protein n=1 Tax=Proteocatella sphenisci TaxID=181070 RepID=UPI0004B2678C|nr:HPr family phosphocarrier protein [Proteocatella sphenisci]
MIKKEVKLLNKTGLHARPASEFVKKAAAFKSNISIEVNEMTINAKSIVGMISAGIGYETKMLIVAEGPDEELAIQTLSSLVESKFGE